MTKFDYLYSRLYNAVFDAFKQLGKYFRPYAGTTVSFNYGKLVDGFDVQFDFKFGSDSSLEEISTSNCFTSSRYRSKYTLYSLRNPSSSSLEFLQLLSTALPRISFDIRDRYKALCDQAELLYLFIFALND